MAVCRFYTTSCSNPFTDKSLTFHANKDSAYQINLHVKNLQRSIAKRQQKIMKLSAEIKDMEKKTLGQVRRVYIQMCLCYSKSV